MNQAGRGARAISSFGATVLLVATAACTAAGEQSSTTANSPGPISLAASPAALPSETEPTTHRVTGSVLGEGSFPTYTVAIPDGWSVAGGKFVIKDGAVVIGMSVSDVAKVPTDPCHWQDSMTIPGPTVDDLAEALRAQETRNATRPGDASLAGSRALTSRGRYRWTWW